MRVTAIAFLFILLPGWLLAQANPVNVVQENSARYNVFYDPLFGYSEQDNIRNFSSRNYWMNRAEAAPKDEVAWFNYYRASRFVAEGAFDIEGAQTELNSIDEHLQKFSAGTWEQLIVEYWNSDRNPLKFPQLEQAYKLRPEDPISLRFMMGKEFLSGSIAQCSSFYTKWKNAGEAPKTTEIYAYNVLQSLPADAVLFTNGELDTYPLIWQIKQNNSSVKVISLSFCSRPENRKALFTNAGLMLPENDTNSMADALFIQRVASANPGKKIYVAASCGGAVLEPIQDSLYCTGLAFRYSSTPLEHLSFLKNNVGTKMKLDQVGKGVGGKNRFDLTVATDLEMNYYLPLLLAADQYASAGNGEKAKELRAKATKIRIRAGYEQSLRSEE
ncbi:MAG: hypothetical protein L6Q81_07545 [Bacteroidia bacterium]|nr:hypothetical protein [Bacteroidia bacterium]